MGSCVIEEESTRRSVNRGGPGKLEPMTNQSSHITHSIAENDASSSGEDGVEVSNVCENDEDIGQGPEPVKVSAMQDSKQQTDTTRTKTPTPRVRTPRKKGEATKTSTEFMEEELSKLRTELDGLVAMYNRVAAVHHTNQNIIEAVEENQEKAALEEQMIQCEKNSRRMGLSLDCVGKSAGEEHSVTKARAVITGWQATKDRAHTMEKLMQVDQSMRMLSRLQKTCQSREESLQGHAIHHVLNEKCTPDQVLQAEHEAERRDPRDAFDSQQYYLKVEIEEEEARDCLALRARIRLLNSRLVQRADSKRFFIASMNELQHSPVLSTANTNLLGSTRLLLFKVSSSSSDSSPPSN